MSMIVKFQQVAVALLMSIVMVITGKELFKTSCVDSFALVWFGGFFCLFWFFFSFLVSDPLRVFLSFYFDKFCIWHRI